MKKHFFAHIGFGLSAVAGLDRLVSIDTAVLCPRDLVLAVRARGRGADVGLSPRGTGEVGRAPPTSLAEGPILLLTRLCRDPMLSRCFS